MLNSLRDGQINYGTTNCPSAHVPPHNVVAPIHQNSLLSAEPTTPMVHPWSTNPRLEQLYGFHSRYYNLDFPTPYSPATNQYVPANMYGQNLPQCCQPCCRLRSQNIPKTSPPPVLYNPRPVQQLNRSYKSKKTLKNTPCSEQFLPYIPNDLPMKYDTQNCYQQKYSNSYLNNANYCPPTNNLWMPPAPNPAWSADRLRSISRPTGVVSHDYSRDKNYQRLPSYQSNPYANPTGATHHRPYSPPIPDLHDYRPSIYHNQLKTNSSPYITHDHNPRLSNVPQNNQSPSSLQQYYNTQPMPYSEVQRPSDSFKSQSTPQNSSKTNLNVREFLATWDEGEEEITEKSSESNAPIVVLDCMTLEGDALTKLQEKFNVVSYENLEKVLKENSNPLILNTEPNEINSIPKSIKPPTKSSFEPLDYTKRETGIIKPFITEKKNHSEVIQPEKSYSVNFDGMVAWYGKNNADISSTDLMERLADRIFNLSKSQENEGVSFGTAAYTGQITQTSRSIESSGKDPSKYIQNQQMFDLHHPDKCIEPSVINKIHCNDSVPRDHSCALNENKASSIIKSNNTNSSCIVENVAKKCLNVGNVSEETTPWNLDQNAQEQHLNMSLYDHSVIIKPLDFSSLTDETKGNPFMYEKNASSGDKANNNNLNDQFNKVLNENNNYSHTVSNNQHSIQQIDSGNRNLPVIVSSHIHRQEYNGFHESVIQRTGSDKNKDDKVSAQNDFENMNWNISNDLDKIMKNTNLGMETSCLYDRNNYNILDNINSDKNISSQWKDNIPCVDLTVNNKTNPNHDSFFDGWNFIENYENHSGKKSIYQPSSNEVQNSFVQGQMTSLEESNIKNNNSGIKVKNDTSGTIKNSIPFSKSNEMPSSNECSKDVFNFNNRIPDFNDSFELSVINETPEYMSSKKPSSDNEHRTDGSIFEHLSEPKCIKTANETINIKNDHYKSDIIGLPSFKEKEPLAPMPVPPKLNIVKPIVRDPNQIYTVIKQKLKYDNTCADTNGVVANKTGHSLRGNQITGNFNEPDLKSKFNSVQLNQFDVWSEKFVLKGNPNDSSSAVVQCDVEVTQFKSTPENRSALILKPNINENNQEKNTKLSETANCNLSVDKINVIENEKMNSNDFLNCIDSSKINDQKYRDTLDEFETSFGFDMHSNNESNKSFHEEIVDKCLEERINDEIGEHNMVASNSSNTSDVNTSNNTHLPNSKFSNLPFQCDFQSGYLIKNYFDENKNKTDLIDQKDTIQEKSDTIIFNYDTIENNFGHESNKKAEISVKNAEFNILTHVNDIGQIQTSNKHDSRFINQTNLNNSFETNHEFNVGKTSIVEKNNFDYIIEEDHSFELQNNKKGIIEQPTHSKQQTEINSTKINNGCEIMNDNSNVHKSSNNKKKPRVNVNFELNVNSANIFKSNSPSTSSENIIETNENLELKNNENSFDSTFHCKKLTNIEPHNNDKNIFKLENNNSSIYEIHNIKKIHEFDFEARIVQNFEIDCSNNNVPEQINSKKVTNEDEINTEYNYKVDHDEKIVHKDTNFKNNLDINEEIQMEDTPSLSCNADIQLQSVHETKNKVNESFEVNCIDDTIHGSQSSEMRTDVIQNESNENNINNECCYTQKNPNFQSGTVIENIFDNFYNNLTNLNTEKNNFNVSKNNYLFNNDYDVLNSEKNTENQNLRMNNSEMIDKQCKETEVDECREKIDKVIGVTDSVLLQKCEDNFTFCSTTHLQPNTPIEEVSSEKLTLEERNAKEDDKSVSNENVIDISNEILHETAFEEQQSEYMKQNEIEPINKNNMHDIKNTTVNTVQGHATKKIFENIKSDLLNVVQNTDEIQNKMHDQNNASEFIPLNYVEPTHHNRTNEFFEVENCTKSPSFVKVDLKTNDSTCDEETNFKITSEDVKLPRVKFVLKRHSMMKTNVFEDESMANNKKINAIKDSKNFIARNFLKKRVNFYKPWRNKYKKQSIEEREENLKVEAVFLLRVNPVDTAQNNKYDLNDVEENVAVSFSELNRTSEHSEDSRSLMSVEDELYYDSLEECSTPVPSPYDDFQSESDTSEHVCEEFWDKSLENEYKNVLHKAISKLAKNSVNIRDKFNIRILARRGKQKNRRSKKMTKRRVVNRNSVTGDVVAATAAVINVPTAAKPTKNSTCKIKVQLPWGRIFNLNHQNEDSCKDTKLELGPAKVEVILSRTPGEWQVAACQSMAPKSVVSVKRLVLQRATSPKDDESGSSRVRDFSRKLPKIVIRRNGEDNYTSYVSSGCCESSRGDDIGDESGCNGGGPRLTVRLVRDPKLDAMAATGITTIHLKHLVPISDSDDTTHAKRVRYT